MQIVQSCTNVNSNRISYRYISHEISNYSETYNVPMIEKINEHKPKRQVHFFPQPSRGPFEALPLAQQGAEWALLGAHFGPFCAQCGLAQKGPEWSRGPKRTGAQSGSPSWPQLPTQLGPIRGPHGNAARDVSSTSRPTAGGRMPRATSVSSGVTSSLLVRLRCHTRTKRVKPMCWRTRSRRTRPKGTLQVPVLRTTCFL